MAPGLTAARNDAVRADHESPKPDDASASSADDEALSRLREDLRRRRWQLAELEASITSLHASRDALEAQLAAISDQQGEAQGALRDLDEAVAPLRDLTAQLLQHRASIALFEERWVEADERVEAAQVGEDKAELKAALRQRDDVAGHLDETQDAVDRIFDALHAAVQRVDHARLDVQATLLDSAQATPTSFSREPRWLWLLLAVATVSGLLLGWALSNAL